MFPDLLPAEKTNGSGVILTTGMLDFVRSDSELALVVSHEMAHNTMGHIESKMGNRLIGALIGALAGAAIGPGAGQEMTQPGADVGEMAFSQEFESEAEVQRATLKFSLANRG